MKKMRKLIPALAMLLVSAVMMSTASFAWFSMSTTATATNMQVQATAAAGILITNEDGGTWASTANAKRASASLKPVSTQNGATWCYNTSDDASSVNANNTTDTYGTTAAQSTTGEYYLYNKFFIKSSSSAAVTGTINLSSITLTVANNYNLDKAARVLVKCGDNVHIYSIEAETYSVLTAHANPSATDPADKVNKFTSVTSKVAGTGKTDLLYTGTVAAVTADTGTANVAMVEVYVYFEGEDENCFSNNLQGVQPIGVEMAFTFVASGT